MWEIVDSSEVGTGPIIRRVGESTGEKIWKTCGTWSWNMKKILHIRRHKRHRMFLWMFLPIIPPMPAVMKLTVIGEGCTPYELILKDFTGEANSWVDAMIVWGRNRRRKVTALWSYLNSAFSIFFKLSSSFLMLDIGRSFFEGNHWIVDVPLRSFVRAKWMRIFLRN